MKINETEYSLFFLFQVLQELITHFAVISDDCNDLKVISLGFEKCSDYDAILNVFFQLETLCYDFSSLLDFLSIRVNLQCQQCVPEP